MLNAAYALLPTAHTLAKPVIYASLEALARRIHRDRGREALMLSPQTLTFQDRVRKVTAIYAIDQVGDRRRFIGYAWHAGRDWRALEAALQALVPPAVDAAA